MRTIARLYAALWDWLDLWRCKHLGHSWRVVQNTKYSQECECRSCRARNVTYWGDAS